MILKFKNYKGEWEYVDKIEHPIVKKNDKQNSTDVMVGKTVHHIFGEAYLLNDHGQTIERLN